MDLILILLVVLLYYMLATMLITRPLNPIANIHDICVIFFFLILTFIYINS